MENYAYLGLFEDASADFFRKKTIHVSICVGSYLARRKEEGSNEARREAVSSARHLQKYEEVGAKKEPVYLSPST